MSGSSFFTMVYMSIFLILVLHFSMKMLLKEKIFRHNIFEWKDDVKEPYIEMGEIKSELLDYIKTHLKDIESNEYKKHSIKGSNYYGKFHDSDLHNEETDLSKYFQVEQSVPDTKQLLKQIQCGPMSDKTRCKEEIKPFIDNLSGNPYHFDQGSDGSVVLKPDMWTYKDEKPMNGGDMDGVGAFDDMQDNFVMYAQTEPLHQPRESSHTSSYPYIVSAGKH